MTFYVLFVVLYDLVTMILALDLYCDVFTEVEGRVLPVSLILILVVTKTKVEIVVFDFLRAFAWSIITAFMQILFLLMDKAQVNSKA